MMSTGEGPPTWLVNRSAYRKLEELAGRHSAPRGINFSVQARRKQKAGRACTGLVRPLRESKRHKASYTHGIIDELLVSTRFELAGEYEAFNFVVGVSSNRVHQGRRAAMYFLAKAGGLSRTDPNERVLLFVLMDANGRTGHILVGCSDDKNKVLGAYGRDVINDNDTRFLLLATNCKLDLTDTFFSTRMGGTSRTHNDTDPTDRERIDYRLTRQVRRSTSTCR